MLDEHMCLYVFVCMSVTMSRNDNRRQGEWVNVGSKDYKILEYFHLG